MAEMAGGVIMDDYDYNGEFYADVLEQINDLHEQRLDDPDLGDNIFWLKKYAYVMDKIFSLHMSRIEMLEHATSHKI